MRAGEVRNAILQIAGHRLALDRQDAKHDTKLVAPRPGNERTRHRGVENRLRYHELGARGGLAFEQFELAPGVLAIGIGDRAEPKLRSVLSRRRPSPVSPRRRSFIMLSRLKVSRSRTGRTPSG